MPEHNKTIFFDENAPIPVGLFPFGLPVSADFPTFLNREGQCCWLIREDRLQFLQKDIVARHCAAVFMEANLKGYLFPHEYYTGSLSATVDKEMTEVLGRTVGLEHEIDKTPVLYELSLPIESVRSASDLVKRVLENADQEYDVAVSHIAAAGRVFAFPEDLSIGGVCQIELSSAQVFWTSSASNAFVLDSGTISVFDEFEGFIQSLDSLLMEDYQGAEWICARNRDMRQAVFQSIEREQNGLPGHNDV
jgi:hypothetical protein